LKSGILSIEKVKRMDEKEAVRDYVEAEAAGKAGEPVLVASFSPPDD
jgi:hypothetical protein